MMKQFNGTRIRQAREILGLSREEFAGKVGCGPSELVRYEANLSETPRGTAERISIATGFSPRFFAQPDPPGFPLGSLLFHTLPPKCSVCGKRAEDSYLCDFPTGEECTKCLGYTEAKGFHACKRCLGSGVEPCSKPLCAACTVTNGLPAENVNRIDHCPTHG
jgi:hypothetical protein